MVSKGGDLNIDIGANASAEEAEETLEEGAQQVIDVVDGFRMTKMEFGDKKQLAGQMKGVHHNGAGLWRLTSRVPQKGCGTNEGDWQERGRDQGIPDRSTRVLYQEARSNI